MILDERAALILARQLANENQVWYNVWKTDAMYLVIPNGEEPADQYADFIRGVSPEIRVSNG